MALRKSGNVDFYWNFTLVDQTTCGSYQSVDSTFESLFLQKKTGERQKIDTSWDSRVGLDVIEDY